MNLLTRVIDTLTDHTLPESSKGYIHLAHDVSSGKVKPLQFTLANIKVQKSTKKAMTFYTLPPLVPK